MKDNKKLAIIFTMAILSTLCLLSILVVAICSGFDKIVIICGATSLATCATVWIMYLVIKNTKKKED